MTDVQWAAAMGPPGGGRTFVTSRVLRHFSTLACVQVGGGVRQASRSSELAQPPQVWLARRFLLDTLCPSTHHLPSHPPPRINPHRTRQTPQTCCFPKQTPQPKASDDTLGHIFGSILSWHLSRRGFPPHLAPLAGHLVSATLEVYSAAAAKLLPTPAKSHYLFNLRDFARVVQASG
jgi:hypothetical protein